MRALHRILLAGAALACATAGPARATPNAADKIPPNEWGCTLCHRGAGATVDVVPAATAAVLSNFGGQWRGLSDAEIDRTWRAMASENADADGCSNGCELDDPFGNYVPGNPPPTTRCAEGDPNLGDCTIPLNDDSWSTLKALFSDG